MIDTKIARNLKLMSVDQFLEILLLTAFMPLKSCLCNYITNTSRCDLSNHIPVSIISKLYIFKVHQKLFNSIRVTWKSNLWRQWQQVVYGVSERCQPNFFLFNFYFYLNWGISVAFNLTLSYTTTLAFDVFVIRYFCYLSLTGLASNEHT